MTDASAYSPASDKGKDIATLPEIFPANDAADVARLAESINLADPALSITYGTRTMNSIAQFADSLLGQVRVKDAGPLGENLTSLMLTVKDLDVDGLSKPGGFLERMPLIGGLFNKVDRTLARYQTLTGQIDGIVKRLDASMLSLLRDIEVLEQLYQKNAEFHNDLVLYIAAGKKRLEKAMDEELPALKAEADAQANTLVAQKVHDLQESARRFERRLHDLELSRSITLQSAPQIRLIQSNNQTLAEKIQTSILSTIPIWKGQLVLALSLYNQRGAAALQKEVADTTNAMLRKNAEMLEDASLATAREVERSIVDIETLRDVHAKLIATIEETLGIAQEGRAKRLAVEKELAGMETELKDRLLALTARKTRETRASVTGANALPEEDARLHLTEKTDGR